MQSLDAYISQVARKLGLSPVPQWIRDELGDLFVKWYTTDQACVAIMQMQKKRADSNGESPHA